MIRSFDDAIQQYYYLKDGQKHMYNSVSPFNCDKSEVCQLYTEIASRYVGQQLLKGNQNAIKQWNSNKDKFRINQFIHNPHQSTFAIQQIYKNTNKCQKQKNLYNSMHQKKNQSKNKDTKAYYGRNQYPYSYTRR